MTEKPKISKPRIFKVYTSTDIDLQKVKSLDSNSCPRRYCWWWHSLSFDWEITEEEGCTFLTQEKHPEWKYADVPCSRCNSTSSIDHYERREPHLMEDQIDLDEFTSKKST